MLLLAFLAAVCINSQVENVWLIDTFLDLRDPEGNTRHYELRLPCCTDYGPFLEKFCTDNEMDDVAREYVAELLKITAEANDECRKLCGTDFKPPIHLYSITFTMKEVNKLELQIYTGDGMHLETRLTSVCERFELEGEECNEIFDHMSKSIRKKTIEKVERLRVTDPGSDESYRYLFQLIDGLLQDIESIKYEASEKSKAYMKFVNEFRQKDHDQYRKIIELSAKLNRLPEETSSSISYFGLVLQFFKSSEKFPDYTALLEQKYDELMQQLSAVGNDHQQCMTESTCAAGNNILPTKLPMLRINYNEMTFEDYVALANLSIPFIFTGALDVEGQPGIPNWTFDRIKQSCGHEIVPLKYKNERFDSEWAGIDDVTEETLATFIDQVQDDTIKGRWPESLRDLYLHDWSVAYNCKELLEDYVVPKYFSLDYLQRTKHSSSHRDFWPSLFIGNKGTASGLHADWAATSAWMGLIKGHKRWAIGTPMDRPLYYESVKDENQFDVNLMEPNFDKYPLQRFTVHYEEILGPGEIIFIPAACPHQVQNLDQIIAVAANLVDIANLKVFNSHLVKFKSYSSGIKFKKFDTLLEELADREKFPLIASYNPQHERSYPFREFKRKN